MYKPENALRRARDFEAAGDKDKAMEHLYEILTARKMGRQWQQGESWLESLGRGGSREIAAHALLRWVVCVWWPRPCAPLTPPTPQRTKP
jgi:hypothetical protein